MEELQQIKEEIQVLTDAISDMGLANKEVEKRIDEASGQISANTDRIGILTDCDIERKTFLFSLRAIVLELSNVLLDEHDAAIEQKVRSRVDKLKTLVNPLR